MYVLYHDSCPDGFCAAFLCWKQFGDNAKYIPVQYNQPLPPIPDQEEVFIVDFSYPADVLLALADRSTRVVVLDHHKTAKEALEGLDHPRMFIHFDMQQSGACLTWHYFHPLTNTPTLVQYVQDRDLWTWALVKSREVSAGLRAVPMTFHDWDKQFKSIQTDDGFVDIVSRGEAILTVEKQMVDAKVKKAIWVKIAGVNVPAVNSSMLQSEIGEGLNLAYPNAYFAAIWFMPDLNTQVWSLRTKHKHIDVSTVAKLFGGGGHPGAAGFTVTPNIITQV